MIVAHLVKKCPALYRIQRFSTVFTTVPILSHMNPVHTLLHFSLKINFNIILSSVLKSSEWLSTFMTLVSATYPIHLIFLDFIVLKHWCRVQFMKLSTIQFFMFSCYLILLRFKHCLQRPVLKHPQSVSSLNVWDQVSHRYRIIFRHTAELRTCSVKIRMELQKCNTWTYKIF